MKKADTTKRAQEKRRQYHPVLPALVFRGKNLYVGTSLPLGQVK